MAKVQSPLLGYNNNVRHRGRLFHIQTEDSGVSHPHIITHVFMDGGRILKSQKRSYAEHVGTDGLSETVKQMMKEQHKAMFIALRDGQFDALVEGAVNVGAPAANAPPPKPAAIVESKAAAPATQLVAEGEGEEAAPQTIAEQSAKSPPTDPESGAPATTPDAQPPPRRPSVKELTLDFDALDRESESESEAADSGAASPMFAPPPLPPPPPNLFAAARSRTVESSSGAYRTVELPAEETRPSREATAQAPRASPAPPRPPSHRPSESRYAPARPAAIFGPSAKPASTSIFGAELFGDKSLDEVILSYLAEDLDPTHGK